MKKTLILVLIAVFVMIPLASFAKTAISDSELSTVTGEAGISISIDVSSIIGISNIFSTSWGVPTNGSSINHHHPIITFFNHFFPTHTGGIYVPRNGGSIITITAH